jgi:hypothetical protein
VPEVVMTLHQGVIDRGLRASCQAGPNLPAEAKIPAGHPPRPAL